jgi:hypothetical protein
MLLSEVVSLAIQNALDGAGTGTSSRLSLKVLQEARIATRYLEYYLSILLVILYY